jgi:hypothetical protein
MIGRSGCWPITKPKHRLRHRLQRLPRATNSILIRAVTRLEPGAPTIERTKHCPLNPTVNSYIAAGPAPLPATDRRCCRGAANGFAVAGESSRAAGLGPCLFRRFPDLRGARRCACVSGAADETPRSPKKALISPRNSDFLDFDFLGISRIHPFQAARIKAKSPLLRSRRKNR